MRASVHDPAVYAKRWMAFICLGLLIGFAGVLARLIQLHTSKTDAVPAHSTMTIQRLGLRGKILDRSGVVLAESVPGRKIFVDPCDPRLKRPNAMDSRMVPYVLAEVLDIDEDAVIAAFSETKKRFVPLCTTGDEDKIERLFTHINSPSNTLYGIGQDQKEIRAYPHGRSLSHVLGFVNANDDGVYGIEQKYQEHLKGIDGYISTRVNARRKEIRSQRGTTLPEIPGANIYLTIDNNIQYIIEKALHDAMDKYAAESGSIIVQRPATGEILAMASLPDFDPQVYNNTRSNLWINPVISHVYEPGSVMKSFTVASALQLGLISPKSRFDVGKSGIWFYGGKPIRDHAYGIIDTKTVLAKSSNIATARIGLLISEPDPAHGFTTSNQRFEAALRSFGFGTPTDIDLPGEEGGIFMNYKRWNKLTPTRVAFGQGISVTPIQLITAYSTLANGGYRMRPYIVQKIISSGDDQEPIYQAAPQILGTPISSKTSQQVRTMLQAVVDPGGTATRAALPAYTVAGKTGTAQIPVRGGYSNTDYNATFVGFFPVTKPEITILVTFKRPHPVHTGGAVSAPVFARIAQQIADYLTIPPDKQ